VKLSELLLPAVADLDDLDFEPDFPPLDWLTTGEPPGAPQGGVKLLMLAVLEDGIRSYLGSEVRARTEAECWVESPAGGSPFAFRVVCESLGLEPSAVRAALRRLRTKKLRSRRGLRRTRPNVRRRAGCSRGLRPSR
jgi:hypothetical protein